MKKTIVSGAIITSFLLSSCALFNIYETEAKELNVYAIDELISSNKKFNNNDYTCKISPLFIKGEKYIPYLSLSQYASLYDSYLDDNAKSEVSEEGLSASWTISINGEIYFYAVMSGMTKSISVAGSISNTFKSESNPNDYSSLTYATEFKDSYERLSNNNYAEYTFRNATFKSFRKNNEYYYPLGLFDNAFSESSNIYHFYNYKNIYSSWSYENYAKSFTTSNGQTTSVDQEMEEMTKGESIPSYLVQYNAGIFIFTMQNFYGLKSYYGISNMREFYRRNNLYDGLFSTNGKTRGDAYARALAIFDDHHTAIAGVNNAWGEGETQAYGGKNIMKRQYLATRLSRVRKDTYQNYFNFQEGQEEPSWGNIVYSQDNKTAMFHFESFDFGENNQVFHIDGSIKSDAYKYDTYYNVLDKLNTIKAYHNGSVENVIIDISTNGGGVVGIMSKVLALLSKNNKASIQLMDESIDVVYISDVSVDANGDEKYDANDAFGNDFNIYLLVSDVSFSSSNALACYAQRMGIKLIGEKTGGGECAVAVHYMPNSEIIYHSSLTHLGYYDRQIGKFTGFESGANPDISLVPSGKTTLVELNSKGEPVYNVPANFYDINHLGDVIAQEKTK